MVRKHRTYLTAFSIAGILLLYAKIGEDYSNNRQVSFLDVNLQQACICGATRECRKVHDCSRFQFSRGLNGHHYCSRGFTTPELFLRGGSMTSFGNNIWNSSIDVDDDDNEDDDGRRSVDSQNSIISPDELIAAKSSSSSSSTRGVSGNRTTASSEIASEELRLLREQISDMKVTIRDLKNKKRRSRRRDLRDVIDVNQDEFVTLAENQMGDDRDDDDNNIAGTNGGQKNDTEIDGSEDHLPRGTRVYLKVDDDDDGNTLYEVILDGSSRSIAIKPQHLSHLTGDKENQSELNFVRALEKLSQEAEIDDDGQDSVKNKSAPAPTVSPRNSGEIEGGGQQLQDKGSDDGGDEDDNGHDSFFTTKTLCSRRISRSKNASLLDKRRKDNVNGAAMDIDDHDSDDDHDHDDHNDSFKLLSETDEKCHKNYYNKNCTSHYQWEDYKFQQAGDIVLHERTEEEGGGIRRIEPEYSRYREAFVSKLNYEDATRDAIHNKYNRIEDEEVDTRDEFSTARINSMDEDMLDSFTMNRGLMSTAFKNVMRRMREVKERRRDQNHDDQSLLLALALSKRVDLIAAERRNLLKKDTPAKTEEGLHGARMEAPNCPEIENYGSELNSDGRLYENIYKRDPVLKQRVVRDNFATKQECIKVLGSTLCGMRGCYQMNSKTLLPVGGDSLPKVVAGMGLEGTLLVKSLFERTRRCIMQDFKVDQLYLNACMLQRIQGTFRYWNPHIDKANIPSYDYSALLYLTTKDLHFSGGGDLVFIDEHQDVIISPVQGRLVAFTSGTENLHRVERVSNGTRIVLSMWFTTNKTHEEDDSVWFDPRAQATIERTASANEKSWKTTI
eukprot:jgi/Bigna1/130671/aug1.12_g5379